MAVDRLPDLESLATELVQLRHRQGDLLRQHDKLSQRMAAFPNDFGLAWARSMTSEMQAVSSRIEELEAQLMLYRG